MKNVRNSMSPPLQTKILSLARIGSVPTILKSTGRVHKLFFLAVLYLVTSPSTLFQWNL